MRGISIFTGLATIILILTNPLHRVNNLKICSGISVIICIESAINTNLNQEKYVKIEKFKVEKLLKMHHIQMSLTNGVI